MENVIRAGSILSVDPFRLICYGARTMNGDRVAGQMGVFER
jgi:hypothetical protein